MAEQKKLRVTQVKSAIGRKCDQELTLRSLGLGSIGKSHEIVGEYGAGRVIIRPAVRGTGVKAGGPVRAIMELAGVTDVITKSLGTSNAMNIVKATAEGLKNMQNPEEVAERRGVSVDYIWGRKEKAANAEEAE